MSWAQNPAVAGPNSGMERRALAKLKWLVVREMVETETASFWYDSPEVQRGELRPEDIQTEVFLMPAAGHAEKDGTFTNTQRLLQWREKAVDPPGDCRSENWFMLSPGHAASRKKRSKDPRPRNAGLARSDLGLSAPKGSIRSQSPKKFCRKSTATPWLTGSWLPGSLRSKRMARRPAAAGFIPAFFPSPAKIARTSAHSKDFYGHGWGFAWPSDRRIIYNRASARPDGKPWSERKKLVWWDDAEQKVDWHRCARFCRHKAA